MYFIFCQSDKKSRYNFDSLTLDNLRENRSATLIKYLVRYSMFKNSCGTQVDNRCSRTCGQDYEVPAGFGFEYQIFIYISVTWRAERSGGVDLSQGAAFPTGRWAWTSGEGVPVVKAILLGPGLITPMQAESSASRRHPLCKQYCLELPRWM